MNILVCNAGSTSLKFKLVRMPEERVLAAGKIERIRSGGDSVFRYENMESGKTVWKEGQDIESYSDGIRRFILLLTSREYGVIKDVKEIRRVGFKTVLSKNHYGVHELSREVLKGMEEWRSIAPVHNGAYLEAIAAMREYLPDCCFVGAFETAFHRDIPLERRLYGLPFEWYQRFGIQRMGYHGTSHSYVADTLNQLYPQGYRAISCHLGGSSSVCAIRDGKSVDVSWGFSLQSGILHGSRMGHTDGDLFLFLEAQGLSRQEIQEGMRSNGGLLGISGVSQDIRYIQKAAQEGNERARLALQVFAADIVHYIGAFYMELGGMDELVFTAGIGEHSGWIRRMVCEKLSLLGIRLSHDANEQNAAVISERESRVKVRIIPADEEICVARRTYEYQEG